MSVLDIHSIKVEKGAYGKGAMVGDCLYLMTEPATLPDVMLCMRLGKDKGISENVEEVGRCVNTNPFQQKCPRLPSIFRPGGLLQSVPQMPIPCVGS